MLALPADTLARRGSQSGQITCYEMRTDHVLSTNTRPAPCPRRRVRLACPRPIRRRQGRQMGRGPKPAKSKEAKPPIARQSPKDGARVRDLEARLAETLRDKAEAQEQQAATAEILRVINSSPTDVQPVFDAIAREAVRLCGASYSVVGRYDGELIHLAAYEHVRREGVQAIKKRFPLRPSRGTTTARAILDRAVVHLPDVLEDEEYDKSIALGIQNRSTLAVPMLRHGEPIGTISVGRLEPSPFTDKQIALLQTFADQAVIAIENVRLFNETQEALEQQTATAEILRVISSSPTDIQPVFDAIAQSAARLCEAFDAVVYRVEGHALRPVTHHGSGEVGPLPLVPGTVNGRAVIERRLVHVTDVQAATSEFPEGATISRREGTRSMVSVPLLREGRAIGTIGVRRFEIRPFGEKQIALLRTFADQAVIAIENVRLFNETKEALDRQTATSEILQVISGSLTDVQPVFDAIIASAVRLLGGHTCGLTRVTGDQLELVALTSIDAAADAPVKTAFPQSLHALGAHPRAIRDRVPLNVADACADARLAEGERAFAGVRGFRSWVVVPMLRDDVTIGSIGVTRREAGGFTADEIALLQVFADQAVIAIENVRLFTELQASNRELTTALDKQTATSDILRVISQSQTDVQPVFDAIVGSAVRLLRGSSGGLTRVTGDQIALVALMSTDDAGDAALRAFYPRPLQSAPGMHILVIRDRVPLNVADAHTDPRLSETAQTIARARGIRSQVAVPLLHRDEAIGALTVNRPEPGGFTDAEIDLLKTFADQAVIAIENVRLFKELQEKNQALTQAHAQVSEALEQQTATNEILRIISRSPTDLQPVLDAVAERAAHLCGASDGGIFRVDGESLRLVAHHASMPAGPVGQFTIPLIRGTVGGRTVLEQRLIHVTDLQQELEDFPEGSTLARRFGHRTILCVPLLREGVGIGCIQIRRPEAQPFTQKQVELLQAFADQAVIAIENVRLFKELEEKNKALTTAHAQVSESLE